MAVSFFIGEVIGAFAVAAFILWSYGKIKSHTVPILFVVLVAWYFSLLIVTILPNDISATFYKQCMLDYRSRTATTTTPKPTTTPPLNVTEPSDQLVDQWYNQEAPHLPYQAAPDYQYQGTGRRRRELVAPPPEPDCVKPPSFVEDDVVSISVLYRIVYWTTQLLTWFLIPFLSAYVQAGEFTVLQKAKTALIDNAIYYGTYVLIFIILLVYMGVSTQERKITEKKRKPMIIPWKQYNLSFSSLKLIGITAANTWGLFLLVLLLGYGLVEIPRSFWHRSDINHQIDRHYFNLAKITEEKHEATEDLDSILAEVRKISDNTRFGHPLRRYVNIICKKCPDQFQDTLCNTDYHEYNDANVPSERTLIRLHKRLNKSMQRTQRTQTQFSLFLRRALFYEDVIKNLNSPVKIWRSYYSSEDSWLWVPLSLKWWWRCFLRSHAMKAVSALFGLLSVMVVWSECTFWVRSPTLSIFALIVKNVSNKHNYFNLEIFCIFIIGYLCFCAYSTLFQIKLFNIYFIAPNHQTDNYSLLFIGMFLCRLTPPLCLNFLGLIHMDSHFTDGDDNDNTVDVSYTQLFGHLDLISDRYNIYFPILIVLLCCGTLFRLGQRCLSSIGFAQFLQSDELTVDLIEEGKALVNREKRRHERDWKKDTYTARSTPQQNHHQEEHVSLLRDTAENDENDNWNQPAQHRPNRSLFDDV